ncbi:MAG: NAD-dependent epimerase/dehydratase family protein [Candidatus Odinarchaeia archaeon]
MKKDLVIGGAGFIGSNLVRRLLEGDRKVVVVDNFTTGNKMNLADIMDKVEIIQGNASNVPEREFSNFETIYYLGFPSSSPMYRENPTLVCEALKDAITVFENSKKFNNNLRLVIASTSSLYNRNPLPYKEDMPIYVTDYYTECRYYVERLSQLYYDLYGVKSIILRFFSVYGPREEYKGRYANIITQFLWKMSKNEAPVIYGDGTQTRDFIYVEDVVNACVMAAESKLNWEIFNVGTGKETSFNEIISILNDKLNKNIKPKYVPNPIKNYVERTLADTAKIEHKLSFKPKYTLEQGIDKTIEYYLSTQV